MAIKKGVPTSIYVLETEEDIIYQHFDGGKGQKINVGEDDSKIVIGLYIEETVDNIMDTMCNYDSDFIKSGQLKIIHPQSKKTRGGRAVRDQQVQQVRFQPTHNQGLHQLFLMASLDVSV